MPNSGHIFHAAGICGTLSRLVTGKKLINSDTKIISIDVSEKTVEHYENVAKLAKKTLTL